MKKINIDALMRAITHDFNEAIIEINSLKDFFNLHSNAISQSTDKMMDKYKIALKISNFLDEIFTFQTVEKKTLFIKKIKEKIIFSDVPLKDILTIEYNPDDDDITYFMSDNYSTKEYNPRTAKERLIAQKKQDKIFSQSILSNAIIIFESYLARVYEIIAVNNSNIYLENKQISLAKILTGDLNSIVKKSISYEIDQNMYDTLKTLDKIKEKSDFDIDRHYKIRKKFEEVYYRRNVYVHNNGRVNDIYLSKVDDNLRKKVEVGQYLQCDQKYLINAILLVKRVICAMYYELLKTVKAVDYAYYELSNVGFESLCSKEYENSEHIYCMLSKTKQFEYVDKAMFEVNYINALKQQGKNIRNLLDNFDVSIATDKYKIAKLCLEDNNQKVFEILNKTYPNTFCAQEIREWPLFIDFRQTSYYEIFKSSHSEAFNKFVFDDSKSCIDYNEEESNDKVQVLI